MTTKTPVPIDVVSSTSSHPTTRIGETSI
jgi:hypothetical protein